MPEEQLVQAVAPVPLYLPTAHAVQVLEAALALTYPAGQLWQEEEPLRENLPAAHEEQLDCREEEVYFPASHREGPTF